MPIYDYRWATGHNVALVSLTNVETDLLTYTMGRPLAPRTNPVDLYPVRRKALSGKVYGDGRAVHIWHWDVLPIAALNYIEDTYLTTTSVLQASKAITIYTRRHDQLAYTRYNAYLELPQPNVDYTYDSGFAVNLNLKLHLIEALA